MTDLILGNSQYSLCKHGIPDRFNVCNACGDDLAELCDQIRATSVAEYPRTDPFRMNCRHRVMLMCNPPKCATCGKVMGERNG